MPTFFQSLASIFGGSANNRDSAAISTSPPPRIRGRPPNSPNTGAFSVPTHSPILGDRSESPSGMNAASSSTTAFSYPPPSNGHDYDYPATTGQKIVQALSPTSRSGRPQSGSPILPLYHGPNSIPTQSQLSPLQSYPPLHHTWNRLKAWLSGEYSELGDTLNYGIDPSVITQIQMELGLPLPSAVRDSYLICDGQEVESSAGCSDGLFFGLTLLPLEDVLEEWRFWREVDEDPATGANPRLRAIMKSIPDGYIRKEYSCRGWLPLITDRAGNYLGVDLHPGDGGTYGQVIVFGRDFDTKVVLWRGEGEGGWGRWLAGFVDELENGEGYELGGGDGSSGSEDDVGYEGYFYSPSGGGVRDGAEGSGGLRLTGEYKGWNVLEAWADRSVKKWIEAGLYKEEQPEPVPHPEIEITDAALVTNNAPAVEVPIPVLGSEIDLSVATQQLPSSGTSDATVTPTAPSPQPQTTTTTVPPKPQPVPIPSAVDLLGGNSPDVSVPSSPQKEGAAASEQAPASEAPKSSKARPLSDAQLDSTVTFPLVGDTSFSSQDSSMSEADLMPASTVPPAENVLDKLSSSTKTDGTMPAASIVPLKPVVTTSPMTEDSESKTPKAAEFQSLPNGTSSTSSPPPAPSGRKPSPTMVALPSSEPGSPVVTRGASAASRTDSRSSTPTSERLQKTLHKKSTRSISKLFGGQVGDKEKERESSSVKGSDEEGSVKDGVKQKRGSALGASLKPLGSGKPKQKKKDVATAAG